MDSFSERFVRKYNFTISYKWYRLSNIRTEKQRWFTIESVRILYRMYYWVRTSPILHKVVSTVCSLVQRLYMRLPICHFFYLCWRWWMPKMNFIRYSLHRKPCSVTKSYSPIMRLFTERFSRALRTVHNRPLHTYNRLQISVSHSRNR